MRETAANPEREIVIEPEVPGGFEPFQDPRVKRERLIAFLRLIWSTGRDLLHVAESVFVEIEAGVRLTEGLDQTVASREAPGSISGWLRLPWLRRLCTSLEQSCTGLICAAPNRLLVAKQ